MSYPMLSKETVLDLVPFGNSGQEAEFLALRLSPPAWKEIAPGQFVMLRLSGNHGNHIWGRPFSICRVTSRDLVVFFQARGRVTKEMAKLRPGDVIDVWGPLGNALRVEKETPTLLLAGGIGIAPFVQYAHTHPTPWNLSMEFGHRLPLDCYPFDSLNEKIDAVPHRENTIEDRDRFIALMEKRMQEHAEAKGLVLACGPTPFLRTVQTFALKHKVRTQLALETRMGCGVGACLGCVVEVATKASLIPPADSPVCNGEEYHNLQTCTCGPNFWAHQVKL